MSDKMRQKRYPHMPDGHKSEEDRNLTSSRNTVVDLTSEFSKSEISGGFTIPYKKRFLGESLQSDSKPMMLQKNDMITSWSDLFQTADVHQALVTIFPTFLTIGKTGDGTRKDVL